MVSQSVTVLRLSSTTLKLIYIGHIRIRVRNHWVIVCRLGKYASWFANKKVRMEPSSACVDAAVQLTLHEACQVSHTPACLQNRGCCQRQSEWAVEYQRNRLHVDKLTRCRWPGRVAFRLGYAYCLFVCLLFIGENDLYVDAIMCIHVYFVTERLKYSRNPYGFGGRYEIIFEPSRDAWIPIVAPF